MKNMMKMVVLFNLLLLLTGCNVTPSRPVAYFEEEVTATITQITQGSWYAGTRHYETRVWITDDKYGISDYFQDYTAGMFYLPKYWNMKRGDKITVIVCIEYYTDNNQIRRSWLKEVSD